MIDEGLVHILIRINLSSAFLDEDWAHITEECVHCVSVEEVCDFTSCEDVVDEFQERFLFDFIISEYEHCALVEDTSDAIEFSDVVEEVVYAVVTAWFDLEDVVSENCRSKSRAWPLGIPMILAILTRWFMASSKGTRSSFLLFVVAALSESVK